MFEEPLVEFFYKNDDLNDPLITDDHVKLLHIAKDDEIDKLKHMAKEINKVLVQLMEEMELRLVDFKVEFGKTHDGEILLADEISLIHVVYGTNFQIQTLIKTFIEMILAHSLKLIKHS